MTDSGSQAAGWLINSSMGPYKVNAIRGGILAGYTANQDSHNLIVQNIMMNDDRNGTDYRCVIVPSTGTPSLGNIIEESDPIILYVAGEYKRTSMRTRSNYIAMCICIAKSLY